MLDVHCWTLNVLKARSILIIKPSSLGDIVHTLPAVAAIRDANPTAQITWVINPEWAPLLRGNRDVNHVHIFPRGDFRGPAAAFNLLHWRKETRRLRPDVALDFQGLLRSAFIARSSCAREIFGMSDAREGSRFFYDRIAHVDRRAHAVERYLKLAETFGAPIPTDLRFPLPTGDALPRFGEDSPFILLHPYARGRRKSLSNGVIIEFCRIFAPMRVILVGHTHRKISPPDNCLNLANQTTLLQLIHLIRTAQFTISVDSGPMHIAAAIYDRLISIHTWSDPLRVGPYNPNAWVWKNGELRRVRDFAAATTIKGNRTFTLDHVALIVEHVRRHCGLVAF
jgi:ADP-heptose:LPS heptosyltransferase